MSVVVETRDCGSLTDAELDELAAMGGAFGIGPVSKAKDEWVLFTSARIDGKIHGFTFSTLERIGGTPCVLLGMMSIKKSGKRDMVPSSFWISQMIPAGSQPAIRAKSTAASV